MLDLALTTMIRNAENQSVRKERTDQKVPPDMMARIIYPDNHIFWNRTNQTK